MAYRFLDYFFLSFHTLLIFFNLFAWIWKPLRRANLVTLLLTGVSWFILGIFYGWGYCPFTQWHWEVLEKLGQHDLPSSYIVYLIARITGWTANAGTVDALTFVFFFVSLVLSVYVNFFRKRAMK
jgi:hypothetical protein